MTTKNHKSRVLRTNQFLGEELAEPLVAYLNEKAGRKKVDLVQKLYAAHLELFTGRNTYRLVKRIRALLRQARLRPYFAVPLAQQGQRVSRNLPDPRWTPDGEVHASLVAGVRSGRLRLLVPKLVNDFDHLVYAWEPATAGKKQMQAITGLVELGRNGFLRRVKICGRPGCGRYFYSRFNVGHVHVFCSKACERKFHRSSEAWKTARSTYMRKYRHHKKLNGLR